MPAIPVDDGVDRGLPRQAGVAEGKGGVGAAGPAVGRPERPPAQLLLYRAAANADRGFPSAEETAIAKAFCNQAGFDVANEALQVMGGLGYSQEELVEYCLRRCRGWMIAGGSIEILKNRIAEAVFERSFTQRPD